MSKQLRLVALAGGVGGAKLVSGLAAVLKANQLTVIGNTGDDFEHLGLAISPDLDTLIYSLAGVANPDTGWGRAEETWNTHVELAFLGGPTWFRLGDKDLALHLYRTAQLSAGRPLSRIMAEVCQAFGVAVEVLPMSDQPVRTVVETSEGELAFQDYFAKQAFQPQVVGFHFEGAQAARATPGALERIDQARAVVLCPSNPFVSLDPILSVPGIREATQRKPAVGVSPIVGGEAVKGPAAKMMRELGMQPSPLSVAHKYLELLDAFILDEQDRHLESQIRALGMVTRVADTMMTSPEKRKALAQEVIDFVEELGASA